VLLHADGVPTGEAAKAALGYLLAVLQPTPFAAAAAAAGDFFAATGLPLPVTSDTGGKGARWGCDAGSLYQRTKVGGG
jgi:hypothetical protein